MWHYRERGCRPDSTASQSLQRSLLEAGKFLIFPAAVVIGLILASASLTNVMAFEVGEPFPFVLLPSLEDGDPMSIADFRGHKLVLHIWASW